ncbi:MAG: hypothetical protein E5W82_10535 [Mesorhizobium sp.]|nr:MAG: hypothetical protein E5W82_10535 [Mesorhizobium sp.]
MTSCFALAIDDDDACELHLFNADAERDSFLWDYAFEHSGTEADTLAEFKAEHDDDVSEAMAACHCGWHTDDMVQEVPTEPVAAARAAVEALAYARDCLKAASAARAADKVRLALSSAKGAVRHAENKAVR